MNTKDLARQWFQAVWLERNPKAIYELMDASATGLTEGGEITGPKDFEEKVFRPFIGAFPDLKVVLDGIVSEGDEAVVRWTAKATHGGPLGEIPASNRKLSFSGMSWLRFENGRIVEGADRYNLHAVLGHLSSGLVTASVRSFEE